MPKLEDCKKLVILGVIWYKSDIFLPSFVVNQLVKTYKGQNLYSLKKLRSRPINAKFTAEFLKGI